MKKIFVASTLATIAFAAIAAAPASAADALAKKGAIIDGTLSTTLSSKTTPTGTTFALTEKDTFFHHNAALKGATVDGHVENVSPAGPTHKASMSVVFDDVKTADGTTYPLNATVQSMDVFEPKTHHIRDAGIILGTAVVGKMVGDKTGHKHGTLAGAAAGVALVSAMKSDITVKQGTLVKLKLNADLFRAPAGSN